ncbi:hypothetical protein EP7_003512 [Isosphaeraceae bacterium EP7]
MAPRNRPRNRTTRLAAMIAFGALVLLPGAGCDPRTLLYFLQPFEPTIPAPGPSLKGRKIIILTHATPAAQADSLGIDTEINRELRRIFREKVKKIEIVDEKKVADWVEAHPNWTDPSEAIKAFEADVAIVLELEAFEYQNSNSPGLLQGNSRTHIQLIEIDHPKNSKGKRMTDQPKEVNTAYDDYRDTVFPVRGPVSVESGVSPASFKKKFVKVVAAEISWHFVEHAPGDDIQDVKFNNN